MGEGAGALVMESLEFVWQEAQILLQKWPGRNG